MGVYLVGNRGRSVSHKSRDDCDVGTLVDEEGRVAVPQIMDSDRRYPSSFLRIFFHFIRSRIQDGLRTSA